MPRARVRIDSRRGDKKSVDSGARRARAEVVVIKINIPRRMRVERDERGNAKVPGGVRARGEETRTEGTASRVPHLYVP